MGVIHKLKPEIKEFILEKRREEPNLGGRKISLLIKEKFNLNVSKSAICLFLKSSGLNLSVGRPRKKKRRIKPSVSLISSPLKQEDKQVDTKPEIIQEPAKTLQVQATEQFELKEEKAQEKQPSFKVSLPEEKKEEILPQEFTTSGIILLKLIDSYLEGTNKIKEIMKELGVEEFQDKLEEIIFLPLFNQISLKPWFMPKLNAQERNIYLEKLQGIEGFSLKVYDLLNKIIKSLRAIELKLNSRERIYLDPGFHTVWSTPHLPYYFSSLLFSVKKQLKEEKLIIFIAPGYESPIKEFEKFLEIMDKEEKIIQVLFYDQSINPIESIVGKDILVSKFIFGLFPWQFGHFRKGKLLSDFKPYYFPPLRKELFGADIEINLNQMGINKVFKLKGIALKKSLQDKIGLFILTNFNSEMSNEELFYNYLNYWPNIEEGFNDYQRRIELSTYFSSWDFSQEAGMFIKNAGYKIEKLFMAYIKILEAYLKNIILPPAREVFSLESIYSLPLQIKIHEDFTKGEISSLPGSEYSNILYLCRRLNETKIYFPEHKRFWLSPPEKKTFS